jgi:hypothetical protein
MSLVSTTGLAISVAKAKKWRPLRALAGIRNPALAVKKRAAQSKLHPKACYLRVPPGDSNIIPSMGRPVVLKQKHARRQVLIVCPFVDLVRITLCEETSQETRLHDGSPLPLPKGMGVI